MDRDGAYDEGQAPVKAKSNKSLKKAGKAIFGVLYVMAKQIERGSATLLIVTAVQLAQMLTFVFNSAAGFDFPPFAFDSLKFGLSLTAVDDFILAELSSEVYLAFFYLSLGYLLVLLLLVTWTGHSFIRRSFRVQWPLKILRAVATITASGLYIPITSVLFSVLQCDHPELNPHWLDAGFKCWTGLHLAFTIVVGLILPLFMIFSWLVVAVLIDRSPFSKNVDARVHGRVDVTMLCVSTVLVVVVKTVPWLFAPWVLATILVLSGVIWMVSIIKRMPFYRDWMNKLHASLAAVYLWATLCAVQHLLISPHHGVDAVITFITSFPLAAAAGYVIAHRQLISISKKSMKQLSSPFEVDLRARIILSAAMWPEESFHDDAEEDDIFALKQQRRRSPEGSPVFGASKVAPGGNAGNLSARTPRAEAHGRQRRPSVSIEAAVPTTSETSAANESGLEVAKKPKSKLIKLGNFRVSEAVIPKVLTLYETAAKRFDRSSRMHVLLALFHQHFTGNRHLELSHLLYAEKRSPAWDEVFWIHQRRRQTEDEDAGKADAQMTALTRVSFEKHRGESTKAVIKAASLQVQFWDQLARDRPDIGRLHSISSSINSAIRKAESGFQALLRINDQSVTALRGYAAFQMEVVNDPERAMTLMTEADRIEEAQAKDHTNKMGKITFMHPVDLDVMSDQLGVITIGGQRHNLGMIKSINTYACKMFGVSKFQALQRNISELLPSPFAEMHDGFLRRYLKTGKGRILDSSRCVFGLDSRGYIFPIVLSVRRTSPSAGAPGFVGLIRELQTADHHMLAMGEDVTVTAASAQFYAATGATPERVEKGDVSLLDYIPEWSSHTAEMRKEAGAVVRLLQVPADGFESVEGGMTDVAEMWISVHVQELPMPGSDMIYVINWQQVTSRAKIAKARRDLGLEEEDQKTTHRTLSQRSQQYYFHSRADSRSVSPLHDRDNDPSQAVLDGLRGASSVSLQPRSNTPPVPLRAQNSFGRRSISHGIRRTEPRNSAGANSEAGPVRRVTLLAPPSTDKDGTGLHTPSDSAQAPRDSTTHSERADSMIATTEPASSQEPQGPGDAIVVLPPHKSQAAHETKMHMRGAAGGGRMEARIRSTASFSVHGRGGGSVTGTSVGSGSTRSRHQIARMRKALMGPQDMTHELVWLKRFGVIMAIALIISVAVLLPVLSTLFQRHIDDMEYISLTAERLRTVQQIGEAAETVQYAMRGWVPLERLESRQTVLLAKVDQLRSVNSKLRVLTAKLNDEWGNEVTTSMSLYDKVTERASVYAPNVSLAEIRGVRWAMLSAVEASLPTAFNHTVRTVAMSLGGVAQRIADMAAVAGVTNFSSYAAHTGSQRDQIWQRNQQLLFSISDNVGRASPAGQRMELAVARGQSIIEADAEVVSQSTMFGVVAIVGLLLLGIVFIYIPILRQVDDLRDDTIQLFLKLPSGVLTALRQQSARKLKAFSRMDDDDGSESDSEDDLGEEEVNWDQISFRRSRHRRKPRKSPWFVIGLFFKLLTPAVIAIGLFIGIYFMANKTVTATNRFSALMTGSANQALLLRQTIRALRQSITETSSLEALELRAAEAEHLSDALMDAHEHMAFDASHRTGFETIDDQLQEMRTGDVCAHITFATEEAALNCPTFLDGVVTQGLTASIGRIRQRIHELLQERLAAKHVDAAGFDHADSSSDPYSVMDVMWGPGMVDVVQLDDWYIRPALSAVQRLYWDAGETRISNLMLQLILISVGCVAVAVLFIVSIFNPYLKEVDKSIRHGKAALLLLPEPVIRRVPEVLIHVKDMAAQGHVRSTKSDGCFARYRSKHRHSAQVAAPTVESTAIDTPPTPSDHSAIQDRPVEEKEV